MGLPLESPLCVESAAASDAGSAHEYGEESTSSIRGNNYTLVLVSVRVCMCIFPTNRMVHAFTAAGLLVQQFLTLCRLARIGVIGKCYIYQGKSDMYEVMLFYYLLPSTRCAVYGDLHYLEAVHLEAERSMEACVLEVQCLPHYAQDEEVIP